MSRLLDICVESCCISGARDYPDLSENEQFLRGQSDLYQYLRESFFQSDDAFYAFWEVEGCYVSCLRVEPYRDGLILSSLETAPDARGNGYAKSLVQGVLAYLRTKNARKIYSHIERVNAPSIAIHLACGFTKISDRAVYLDGSVSYRADTYLYTAE